MTSIRLDKLLADMGLGTRSQLKNHIRKGAAKINGFVVTSPDTKVDIQQDQVSFQEMDIVYSTHEYYMLNKPMNVVSATKDNLHQTVLSLITGAKRNDLFPVGRLDIDTEGLLIITNDGSFSHKILSPTKKVWKTYYAALDGILTDRDCQQLTAGIDIGDDKPTLPAKITILETDAINQSSNVEISICEGRFHQVKRMFDAVGKNVTYLKRTQIGNLKLDAALEPGKYRVLTEEERIKITINSEEN